MTDNSSARSRLSFVLPLGALLAFMLACGSVADQAREAANTIAPTAQIVVTIAQPAEQATTQSALPTAAADPAATQTLAPTTTAEASQEPLTITESGFGQNSIALAYAFTLQNPNANAAVENSQYQVVAYDSAGTVLKTDSGHVELVLPGEKLGIAGAIYLPDNTEASRIEVQLKTGRFTPSESLPNFSVDKVQLQPNDDFPKVTAIIRSPYGRDIDNVRVSAIARDDAGKIIGSGFTFLNFVLAGAQAPVAMSLNFNGVPAKVDLYPTLSGLSSFGQPADASTAKPIVAASGFGGERTSIGFGFIAENPGAGVAFESTQYQAALYDADGFVLAADEGYVELLLPAQTLGVADSMFVPEGATPVKLVVSLLAGKAKKSEALLTFTTENVSFKPDTYSPKVTGIVKSPYGKDVKNLRVSALAFNDAGNIIGGGFTFVDFVPANGQAAVDVSVNLAGTPAHVELHPVLSGLSSFE